MVLGFLHLSLFCLFHAVIGNRNQWCPPKTFPLDANRTIASYRTAVITEIFGQLRENKTLVEPHLASFLNGHLVARNIYNHVGVLGIDKMYLAIFYDMEVFPNNPPSLENVYPSDQYCVAEWSKLGVIEWRPIPYGGPKSGWLLDKHKQPTIDRDYYKTLKAFNPIYAEIRNYTDWIFVLDSDELLLPVNFNVSMAEVDWCGNQHPTLITKILNQMLMAVSRLKLDAYERFIARETLDVHSACLFGYTYDFFKPHCKPVAAFSLPVYVWVQTASSYATPLVKSKYPSAYIQRLSKSNVQGQPQTWKSVYQTKYNPPLLGKSLHHNPAGGHSAWAPRDFHGGLSLEVAHARIIHTERNETEEALLLVQDNSWTELHTGYEKCSSRRRKQK